MVRSDDIAEDREHDQHRREDRRHATRRAGHAQPELSKPAPASPPDDDPPELEELEGVLGVTATGGGVDVTGAVLGAVAVTWAGGVRTGIFGLIFSCLGFGGDGTVMLIGGAPPRLREPVESAIRRCSMPSIPTGGMTCRSMSRPQMKPSSKTY